LLVKHFAVAMVFVKTIPKTLATFDKVEKGTYFSMKTNELIRKNDKLFKIEPTEHATKKANQQ
jgi:putative protease